MTKEIVELPDRKSGDINEIRDKKIALAKDATAQSDLPQQLEYLIKNGQTGEFMNVLDSYINEKIRVALGTLVYNFDKDGAVSRVLGIDANKDLGSTSLGSLASALGGSGLVQHKSHNDYRGISATNPYKTPYQRGFFIARNINRTSNYGLFWASGFQIVALTQIDCYIQAGDTASDYYAGIHYDGGYVTFYTQHQQETIQYEVLYY